MATFTIGIIGFGVLLVLIMLRLPVALSMSLVGFIGFAILVAPAQAMSMVAYQAYLAFTNYNYGAAIMFILMGYIAANSGISKILFQTLNVLLGHIRGGLAWATAIACAAFGAICGSTLATTAAMGVIALPEMDKRNYDHALSTGTVSVSGILGTMIPPSIPLIVYGMTTMQSVSKLFAATIVPGLCLMFTVMMTVSIICGIDKSKAPKYEKPPLKERIKRLFNSGTFEIIFIFAFVLTGMGVGWFTPTEAGAVGAGAMLLVAVIRKRLTMKAFLKSLKDTTNTSAMVFLIVLGASIFGSFISVSRVPSVLNDIIAQSSVPGLIVIILLMLLQLVLGCIMDGMVVLVLTLPIVYPIAMSMGYDPIWLGPMMVLMAGIGMITPPVGMNAYIVNGINPSVKLDVIFRGCWPFILSSMILVILLCVFPDIITFLPKLLGA